MAVKKKTLFTGVIGGTEFVDGFVQKTPAPGGEPAGGILSDARARLRSNFIRNRVAAAVARQKGISLDAARKLVDEQVPDSEITQMAGEFRVGGIGDGGLIKWITDHQEQILALIQAIVKIVLMFA